MILVLSSKKRKQSTGTDVRIFLLVENSNSNVTLELGRVVQLSRELRVILFLKKILEK